MSYNTRASNQRPAPTDNAGTPWYPPLDGLQALPEPHAQVNPAVMQYAPPPTTYQYNNGLPPIDIKSIGVEAAQSLLNHLLSQSNLPPFPPPPLPQSGYPLPPPPPPPLRQQMGAVPLPVTQAPETSAPYTATNAGPPPPRSEVPDPTKRSVAHADTEVIQRSEEDGIGREEGELSDGEATSPGRAQVMKRGKKSDAKLARRASYRADTYRPNNPAQYEPQGQRYSRPSPKPSKGTSERDVERNGPLSAKNDRPPPRVRPLPAGMSERRLSGRDLSATQVPSTLPNHNTQQPNGHKHGVSSGSTVGRTAQSARVNGASAKSDEEAAKEFVKRFLLLMNDNGYGWNELARERLDGQILKDLYRELRIPVPEMAQVPSTTTKKVQPAQKSPAIPPERPGSRGLDQTAQSIPPIPGLVTRPNVVLAKAGSPVLKATKTTPVTQITAPANGSKPTKSPISAAAGEKAPLDRAEYIKRLMAAKAGKAPAAKADSVVPPAAAPLPKSVIVPVAPPQKPALDERIERSKASLPRVSASERSVPDPVPSVDVVERTPEPSQTGAHSSPAAEGAAQAASERKRLQTEAARQRLAALMQKQNNSAVPKHAVPAQASTVVSVAQQAPLRPGAPTEPPNSITKQTSAAPPRPIFHGIPGLSMNGQSPAVKVVSSIQQTPAVAPTPSKPPAVPLLHDSTRKRPVASDFDGFESSETPPAAKRTFGQPRTFRDQEKLIIECSDDEADDDAMDVDESGEQGLSEATAQSAVQQSSSKQRAIRDLPPLTDFPNTLPFQKGAFSGATSELSRTPGVQTPRSVEADELRRKEEDLKKEMEKMRLKIKLQEAKDKAKGLISRTQTPSTPNTVNKQLEVPIETVATELVKQGVVNLSITSKPEQITQQTQRPTADRTLSQERPQTSAGASPIGGSAAQLKARRRAEVDAANAAIASNRSRMEQLRKMMEELEAENRQREQEKAQLVQELEDLGIETEGVSHEDLQAIKDAIVADDAEAPAAPEDEAMIVTDDIALKKSEATPVASGEAIDRTVDELLSSIPLPVDMQDDQGQQSTASNQSFPQFDAHAETVSKAISEPIAGSPMLGVDNVASIEQRRFSLGEDRMDTDSSSGEEDDGDDDGEISESSPIRTNEHESAQAKKALTPPVERFVPQSEVSRPLLSGGHVPGLSFIPPPEPALVPQIEQRRLPESVAEDADEEDFYATATPSALNDPSPSPTHDGVQAMDFSSSFSSDDGEIREPLPQTAAAEDDYGAQAMDLSSPSDSEEGEIEDTEVVKAADTSEEVVPDSQATTESEDELDYEPPDTMLADAVTPGNVSEEGEYDPADSETRPTEISAPVSDESGADMEESTASESAASSPAALSTSFKELEANKPAVTIISDSSVHATDNVADDLAPELQPGRAEQQEESSVAAVLNHNYFEQYESPLRIFHAYRYHPEYTKQVTGGYSSLTFSNKIDPEQRICQYEAAGGVCNDPDCGDQHFRNMSLTDDKVLVQLGATNPGRTDEERSRWNEGLKVVLRDLRSRNTKDPHVVATEIANYRRHFLKDPSNILNL